MSFNTLHKNFKFKNIYYEKIIDWNNRLKLHKNIFNNYKFCDILCLQEADINSIEDDFNFLSVELNYTLIKGYSKKNDDVGFTKPSTFYKKDVLELIYYESRSRIQICYFKIINTNKYFYVLNCHLQANKNKTDMSKIRLEQIISSMKQIKKHSKKISDIENINIILIGDLNSYEDDDIHKYLKEDCKLIDVHDGLNIKTFKSESENYYKRIDYCYVSKEFKLSNNKYKFINTYDNIPNINHPSDHLPIISSIIF